MEKFIAVVTKTLANVRDQLSARIDTVIDSVSVLAPNQRERCDALERRIADLEATRDEKDAR